MHFLIDRDLLLNRLERYPTILSGMSTALKKLAPAQSFPHLWISDSQIVGLVANAHYDHIELTLQKMEECLAHGWNQPKILNTTSKAELSSFIGEIYLASHLIGNSTQVRSLDAGKKETSVPDLLIKKGHRSMVIEIYTPRDWRGLDMFQQELMTTIMNIDMAFDFEFRIRSKLLKQLTPDMKLIFFNPWKFAEKYQADGYRAEVMNLIRLRIAKKLSCTRRSFRTRYTDSENNIRFLLNIRNVRSSASRYPLRSGAFHHPGLTGFAPEVMFEQFVAKKLQRKLSRKQTSMVKGDHMRALFINTDMLGYPREFFHDAYFQNEFARSLSSLNPERVVEDMIVFYNTTKTTTNCIQIPAFFMKPGTNVDVAHELISFPAKYKRLADNAYFCQTRNDL